MASTQIANYHHGMDLVFTDVPQEPLSAGPSGIVGVVGAAADLQVPGRRNVPILIRDWATAAATFGPSKLLNALRIIYDQGPAQCVVVNVFDPATDFGAFSDEEDIALAGDAYVDDALAGKGATVQVKSSNGNTTYVEDTNYTWDPETATLTRKGNTIAANATLKFAYALPDPAGTSAASVVGSDAGSYTGVHALRRSQEVVKATPDVLIAPGFSHTLTAANPPVPLVANELSRVANLLDAIVGTVAPDADDAAAVAYVSLMDDERVFACSPELGVADPADASKDAPADQDALWAGVIASVDAQDPDGVGWSRSPSNRVVRGVRSTSRPIDHSWTKSTSRANYLNSWRINTVFRDGEWRTWGGLTTSSDKWLMFISVVRTRDKMSQALARRWRHAVDARLTGDAFLDDVVTGLQVDLDEWVGLGALRWARASVSSRNDDPAKPIGQSWFRIDFTPAEPNHRMTLEFAIQQEPTQ